MNNQDSIRTRSSDEDAILKRNAERIVRDCAGVREGETVAVITDGLQPDSIARLLFETALAQGAIPVTIRVPAIERPGADLPSFVNTALAQVDVILAPTSRTVYHSPGIQNACRGEGQSRFIALSECDEDTLIHGGINADFAALNSVASAVATQLEHGKRLVLTTPAGTHIVASIQGRSARMIGGLCHKPGDMVGLPTVETYWAPIEDSVNGEVVVDASCSGGIGVIEGEPIRITIENGRATRIAGGTQATQLAELLDATGSSESRRVAEIAIGLNPACRLTGRIIEDEGKYGTCHLAVGSNVFIGGIVNAPIHIDFVQLRPTLVVDDTTVCRDGELVLPGIDVAPLVAQGTVEGS